MLRNSLKFSVDDDTKKEIDKLQEELEFLRASRVIWRHEKKELKQIYKNTNVVWKEFKRSLDEKKSILDTVTIELDTLKDLLNKKQKEYDAYAREVRVLQEVVDTKLIEYDGYESQIDQLKKKLLENANKEQQVRLSLEEKQYGEWKNLLQEYRIDNSITKSMMIKNRVEGRLETGDGIPDTLRGQVWQVITPYQHVVKHIEGLFQSQNIKANQLYYHLLETSSAAEKLIQKDILRSFPNEEFRQRMLENERIPSLFNVLKAYANLDPSLGYCQGMNFVVSFLLLYLNQEETFWMMCMIMHYFKMVGFYQQGKMLPYFVDHFDYEMNIMVPELCDHFAHENIASVMFLTEWFTCMYVYNLSRDTVAKIWDLFFFKNGQQELFKIGLAILKIMREQLLKANMEEILQLLKKKVRHIPASELLKTAQTIRLSPYTVEFLNSIDSQWIKTDVDQRKLIVRVKSVMLSP